MTDDDLPSLGEKRDELFIPDSDGMIINHDETRRLLAGEPRIRPDDDQQDW